MVPDQGVKGEFTPKFRAENCEKQRKKEDPIHEECI
jgi:hypothetical protein